MRSIIFTLCLCNTLGCGVSPLLNHTSPVRTQIDTQGDENAKLKCQFELTKEDLCGSLEWSETPVVFKDIPYTLRFWKKGTDALRTDGPFQSPKLGTLVTDIFMPSMGHGGNGTVKMAALAEGVYQATNVVFIMGGEWSVRIKMKDGSGTTVDETKVDFTLTE